MRRLVLPTFLSVLTVLAFGVDGAAAQAAPSGPPISFSVTVAFTHTSSCPGATCLGHGSFQPYGAASAVLDGDGFDFSTWTLALTVPGGTLDLGVVADNISCVSPGGSGDIPRPPKSNDFGNPVTCAVSYAVVGGTGAFAHASGTLTGTLAFAGAAATLSGVG